MQLHFWRKKIPASIQTTEVTKQYKIIHIVLTEENYRTLHTKGGLFYNVYDKQTNLSIDIHLEVGKSVCAEFVKGG